MSDITLQTSSGYPKIDQILLELICVIEHYFPDRIRGYYLVGSYAVGEAIVTSDLDLVIVFKHSLSPAEKQKFLLVKEECQLKSPLALDFKSNKLERIDCRVRALTQIFLRPKGSLSAIAHAELDKNISQVIFNCSFR